MNILLGAILVVNIAVLAVIWVAFRKTANAYDSLRAEYENIRAQFHTFIYPGADSQGEATASPLATITLALADQAARSVVASLKATFMGQASGEARLSKSLEGDAQLEMISAVNPGVGALIQGIPGLKKLAKRNPELIQAAISRFGGMGAAAPSNGSVGTQAQNNQSNFKI